jgi:hypothetical protein
MWKANGKTTTIFFLDSLFPKTEIYVCEMLPLETKWSGDKLLPHLDLRGGGECFLVKYPAASTTARRKNLDLEEALDLS